MVKGMDFSGSQHQKSISHTLQILFLLSLELSTFPARFNTLYGVTWEGRYVLLIILNPDIQWFGHPCVLRFV